MPAIKFWYHGMNRFCFNIGNSFLLQLNELNYKVLFYIWTDYNIISKNITVLRILLQDESLILLWIMVFELRIMVKPTLFAYMKIQRIT